MSIRNYSARCSHFLKKMLRLCVQIILSPLPIQKNKIIFINFGGRGYGCNPKYIAEKIIEKRLPYSLVWAVQNTDDRFPAEIRKVKTSSLRYGFELATAKIIITNIKNSPAFFKKRGQYLIQTWHASYSPKLLEKAAMNTLDKGYIKVSKRNSRQTDLFLSNSLLQTEEYRENFWCTCEILEKGFPRNDIFFTATRDDVVRIKDELGIDEKIKIALYTPTFRNGMEREKQFYDIDCKLLLESLRKKTNQDWILFIRLHPNVYLSNDFSNNAELVKDVSSYPDVQELMLISDVLITDYSSTMFDFMLMKKPVFLFALDLQEYRNKTRGLKEMYFKLPFPLSESNEMLAENIRKFDWQTYCTDLESFNRWYGMFDNGSAAESVVNKIVQVIGENR